MHWNIKGILAGENVELNIRLLWGECKPFESVLVFRYMTGNETISKYLQNAVPFIQL